MDFQGRLDLVKRTVDKELLCFFVQKREEAGIIHSHCIPIVNEIESLTTRGGKRTRAFLCWLGHITANGKRQTENGRIENDILSAMMALEFFQSFALIHDDIIDEDTVRRGGPTVHEFFKEKGKRKKVNGQNNKHFGDSMAILAGDLALVWADELMGRVKSQKSKVKSKDIYQAMKQEVIFGQTLDVVEEYRKPGIPKELIDMYKTAWYTVIRPLQIGACIAGADQTFLDDLASYGLIAGRAYQLRDDHLDGDVSHVVFEETAETHERDMSRVIASWHQEKAVTQLFIDFFHFVLSRPL